MDNIIKYFEGEKWQCIVGVVISIVFISLSLYFLYLQRPRLKGMAFSFLPLSFFLLIICVAVIFRVPKDIESVTTYYQTESKSIQSEELPRMQNVMKNFGIIKKVEIGIFLVGLILALFFRNNELLRGVAIGLMIESSILLLFDYTAEMRGEVYFNFLKSI